VGIPEEAVLKEREYPLTPKTAPFYNLLASKIFLG
jgi:hypothetical protein